MADAHFSKDLICKVSWGNLNQTAAAAAAASTESQMRAILVERG